MQKRDISRVSLLWATVEHAADLSARHAQLFPDAWSKESFEGLLSHPASTAFIARAGTPLETVGFVIGQIAADEAEILTIGVAADWQRSGLGKRLVESLARAARRAEVRRMHLEVAADNVSAAALYKSLGFTETGRRKAYYQRATGAADAITMSLAV